MKWEKTEEGFRIILSQLEAGSLCSILNRGYIDKDLSDLGRKNISNFIDGYFKTKKVKKE